MDKITNGADHMTLDEFIHCVKCGDLADYDGFGRYATATHVSNKAIHPSDILGIREEFELEYAIKGLYPYRQVKIDVSIDRSFTHVVWYNR